MSYFLWRKERSKETSTPAKPPPILGGLTDFGGRPTSVRVLVRLTEPLPLRVSLGLFIGWRDDDLFHNSGGVTSMPSMRGSWSQGQGAEVPDPFAPSGSAKTGARNMGLSVKGRSASSRAASCAGSSFF